MFNDPNEMADPELVIYVKSEPADVAALRGEHEQGVFPWPSGDNPMLAHLIHQAREIDDRDEASVWLAVHAWYEGALTALARASHEPPAIDREDVFKIMRRLGISEASARKNAEQIMAHHAEERRKIIEGKPL